MMRRVSLLVVSALMVSGCGGLRIERTIIVRPGDVLCFGGSGARTSDFEEALPDSLGERWNKDLSASMGSGSPLLLDSMLLSGTLRGELCAVNVRSGKMLGSVRLDDAIPGSPVIDRNLVIAPLSGGSSSLAAYNLNDGRLAWRKSYGDVEMSPLILHRRIFFGTLGGTAYCVERATGDAVWKFEIPENTMHDGFHASPCASDSTVYFGCDNGSMYAFRATDGTLLWRTPAGGPVMAGSALSNGTIVAGTTTGTLVAFNADSGTLLWRKAIGSPVYGTPAVRRDTFFLGAIDGKVRALRVSDGSELWRRDVEGPVDAACLLAGDKLYVGTLKKWFYALRTTDGSVVWKKELDGRIKTPAIIGYDRLFVTTDEYTLYCFGRTN
jgi:outer membrane protein assembly factor BamB